MRDLSKICHVALWIRSILRLKNYIHAEAPVQVFPPQIERINRATRLVLPPNWLWFTAVSMCHWIGSSFAQAMAYLLFSAKALPEPRTTYHHIDHRKKYPWNLNLNMKLFDNNSDDDTFYKLSAYVCYGLCIARRADLEKLSLCKEASIPPKSWIIPVEIMASRLFAPSHFVN